MPEGSSGAGGEDRSAAAAAAAKPLTGDAPAAAIMPPATHPQTGAQLASAPPPEQHMTVDAPLIFHGDDPSPDLRQIVMTLKLQNTSAGSAAADGVAAADQGKKKAACRADGAG